MSSGSDRLPTGTAGLPSPSPGSGLTPQQNQALGGWMVDPRTGQFAYMQPNSNPAVSAATAMGGGSVPLPRPRPWYAPTTLDMAAINATGNRFGLPTHEEMMRRSGWTGRPSRGTIMVPGGGWSRGGQQPRPTYIWGSSTGRPYQIGSTGTAGGYTYQATPNGFVRTGTDPKYAGMSPSQRDAAVVRAERQRAGENIGHSNSGNSSGNLSGVSSSGRRYDLDNNEWV